MRFLCFINAFLLSLLLLFTQCDKEAEPEKLHPSPDNIDTLQATLSEMGFFYGPLKELNPTDNVIPYDLITPLFSDYAEKSRFIYFPKGTSAEYNANAVLDFPDGTMIIKSFFFFTDERDPSKGRKILETRVLMKKNSTWTSGTYRWRTDQTEADLNNMDDGTEIPVNWIDKTGASRSINYYIPSKFDCATCHENDGINMPIGPKARNINKEYAYKSGTQNQLLKLSSAGLLNGLPDISSVPKVAKYDDPSSGTLELRARAYLDVNCGHCHNPNGQASGSGLMLNYTADRTDIGICKIADRTVGSGLTYDIVPRNNNSSLIIYRMNTNDVIARMPQIGRSIVHEEGLQLIKDWINSMADPVCP